MSSSESISSMILWFSSTKATSGSPLPSRSHMTGHWAMVCGDRPPGRLRAARSSWWMASSAARPLPSALSLLLIWAA